MSVKGLSLRYVSFFVSLVLRVIKGLNSCHFVGFDRYKERLRNGETVLIAFWHNQGLFMPFVYFGKFGRIKLIVSQSHDGELISSLLRWFGIESVRGSSSRGGVAALREFLKLARSGEDSLVFTPDGPKGPVYQVKDGVAYLALHSDKPLYLLSVTCSRVAELRSWDKFRIPLPFGTATFVCSPPLRFPEGFGNQDIPAISLAIEEGLKCVNRIADALSAQVITLKESETLLAPDCLPWSPFVETH